MKGRPRKSSEQRKLEGNLSHRPIPKELEISSWDGTIPDFVPTEALKFWEAFVPTMRQRIFASEVDVPMLILLAATWGLAMKALKELNAGLIRKGRNRTKGEIVKNPAHTVWTANVSLFLQIAGRFGLTPVDRSHLLRNDKSKGEEQDTLDGNWTPQKPASSKLN